MLGIDLNDAGLTAVVHLGDEAVLLPLGDDRVDLPGSLGWEQDRLVLGAEAAVRARLEPSRFTDRAWEDLSHRPSPIGTPGGPPLPWSGLAYRILAHAWERSRAHADPEGSVVIAVPGHLLRGDPAGEEAIGLLLGMVRELRLPLSAIVDSAAVAAPADLGAPGVDTAVHLELTRHAAVLSVIRRDGDHLAAGPEERRAGLGLSGLLDEFEPRLASLFLARTAFDVGHDDASERAFRAESERLLSALVEGPEGAVEAGPPGKPRRLVVDRATAARLAERAARRLVEAARAHAARLGERGSLLLGPQAARVPGLAERLSSEGFAVVLLPPAAAARGAARLARGWRPVSDLSLVPVLRRVPARDDVPLLSAPSAPEPDSLAIDASKGFAPSSGPATVAAEVEGPSHVVFRGLAFPLGSEAFAVGPVLPADRSGLRLPASAGSALPSGPLEFSPSPAGPRLLAPARSRVLLNGAPPSSGALLRPGDRIQVGPEVELILVRLVEAG